MEVFNVKKYKDRHNLSRTLLATLESTGLKIGDFTHASYLVVYVI